MANPVYFTHFPFDDNSMNVALIEKSKFGGIQFYRTTMPYSQLDRDGFINLNLCELKPTGGSPIKVSDYLTNDVIVLPRPYNEIHRSIAIQCNLMGCPLVIDLDDNIFAIPEENEAIHTWEKENLEIIRDCIYLSDHVIVSTEAIKDFIKAQEVFKNVNVTVIPNAWPSKINRQHNPVGEIVNVGWRGSGTHDADILIYKKLIDELSDNPKIKLHWFGHIFPYKWSGLKIKKLPLIQYFKALQSYNINVMLVPLEENDFNRAKSNIAWIEATWAGAIAITNMKGDHWNAKGISRHSHLIQSDRLKMLIETKHAESKRTINKKYQLSDTNEMRMWVLKSVLKEKRVV